MTASETARALVFAPLAEDAETIGAILSELGYPPQICGDAEELKEGLAGRPLCAILSQEALGAPAAEILDDHLASEPSWSALPLIFAVADTSRLPPACQAALDRDPPANAIIVQRPATPEMLKSAIRVQARLRQRQFETARLMGELEDADRHSKFLLSELRHRVGNMLAVAESMVRLTARQFDDIREYRDAIAARLNAMSKASRMLSEDDYEQTPIDEILRLHVEPFRRASGQFHREGPDIRLDGKIAFNFALIVHEMATNAAKYGALSRDDGVLRVTWQDAGDGFELEWKETSGATVTPPAETSFGSIAIQQMTRQLGADGRIDFESDGLRWRFSIPDSASGDPSVQS